jgi:hypothetical protein
MQTYLAFIVPPLHYPRQTPPAALLTAYRSDLIYRCLFIKAVLFPLGASHHQTAEYWWALGEHQMLVRHFSLRS